MTYQTSVISALAACVCSLVLTGCGGSGDESPTAALQEDGGVLSYVPADTPYLFATPEKMPDAVVDKLEQGADSMSDAYATIIRESLDAAMSEQAERSGSEEEAARAAAWVRELTGLLQSENLRAAGISRSPQIAFYGVGLLPVLRVELGNPVAFEAKIAEIEANVDATLTVAEIDGTTYRYVDNEAIRLALAVIDEQAVFTVAPAALSDEQFGQVLGIEKPARAIVDTDVLANLAEDYGFTSYGLGFIDLQRLTAVFLDDPSGVNAELLGMINYSAADLSEVCRTEIRQMAGVMPRLASGYTAVGESRIRSNTVVEVREDLAAAMTALTAPVPGLGSDHGGLLSFGLSLDLLAARDFVEDRINALAATPFQCEYFAGMQMAVNQAGAYLNQPVPPIVYGFKGFLAVVDNIDGLDIESQRPPSEVDARILLANENAQGLLAMGAMFSPELASLSLEPNGEPVPLNLPQLAGQVENAYVAMTDAALALSVGNAAPDTLSELLQSGPGEPTPLFSTRIDGQRYYQFMSEAMQAGSAATAEGEEPMSEEAQEAMSKVMTGVSEIIDRIAVDVNLTNRGVEMPSEITLQD